MSFRHSRSQARVKEEGPMGMKLIWARVVLGWVTSWEVLVKGFHI